jgi:hypothetical protein
VDFSEMLTLIFLSLRNPRFAGETPTERGRKNKDHASHIQQEV